MSIKVKSGVQLWRLTMLFYLVLGLLGFLFFVSIAQSRSGKRLPERELETRDMGSALCDVILGYLSTTDQKNLSPLVFSELFTFSYHEIDSLLYTRKSVARDAIADVLLKTYDTVITKAFPQVDLNYAQNFFSERVDDYAAMTRGNKEKSEMIEKLDFYLAQAGNDTLNNPGKNPVVIGTITESFAQKLNTRAFYMSFLVPFMKATVTKFC